MSRADLFRCVLLTSTLALVGCGEPSTTTPEAPATAAPVEPAPAAPGANGAAPAALEAPKMVD